MSGERDPRRLIALVADRDIQETLTELFRRPESLGVRRFGFEITRHPGRDGGCRADAANFLRQHLRTFHHALVVFDRHGCGSNVSREEIETTVQQDLHRNGWEHRCRAVVIDPELEAWVWSGSRVVSEALGWGHRYNELLSWLTENGLWHEECPKPIDPKQAMGRALEGAPPATRQRRSARVFGEIAAEVSFAGCQDAAFQKLLSTLREWFPQV